MKQIPRPEHPNPQFYRDHWENLNGFWQFEIDHGCSGKERGWQAAEHCFSGEILVPFCPESVLSGIGNTDFMRCVWYKRTVYVPETELSGIVLLHFGAVDHTCTVYVNGREAGGHRGGYVSFAVDVTAFLQPGENVLTVCAEDDVRDPMVARGKQSEEYHSHDCDYTRTTGIWQTVWLEYLPRTHVQSVKYYPNAGDSSVTMEVRLQGEAELQVEIRYENRPVGGKTLRSKGGTEIFSIPLSETHLWEVGAGRLYDVRLTYGEDTVHSYFGLRTVQLQGRKFLLNGKSVFQRLVLDQGFYPDGIYTAPTDEALEADIYRSMDMGFNGARLHEKVFEPRFLYHCDRLGYLAWGEYPGWGVDYTRPDAIFGLLPEWVEQIQRDFNHPAIIGWCPNNEVYDLTYQRETIRMIYRTTKALDPTRLCIDASGGYHVESDLLDIHDYEQDPAVLKERFERFFVEEDPDYYKKGDYSYKGGPVMISETGGIGWSKEEGAWFYGDMPKTEEEFLARFKGIIEALLFNKNICGFCYTQLTDIEQEKNGLYTYDRTPKFEPALLCAVISQKAAIE